MSSGPWLYCWWACDVISISVIINSSTSSRDCPNKTSSSDQNFQIRERNDWSSRVRYEYAIPTPNLIRDQNLGSHATSCWNTTVSLTEVRQRSSPIEGPIIHHSLHHAYTTNAACRGEYRIRHTVDESKPLPTSTIMHSNSLRPRIYSHASLHPVTIPILGRRSAPFMCQAAIGQLQLKTTFEGSDSRFSQSTRWQTFVPVGGGGPGIVCSRSSAHRCASPWPRSIKAQSCRIAAAGPASSL